MEFNKEEIEKTINQTIEQNRLKKRSNNLYLSDYQVDILSRYNIDYQKCSNITELVFKIETYLNDQVDGYYDDLELISQNLSELKYYHNTNK